ncbi:Heat shock 70 kDa protein 4L [Orchesella cincta]|uniref:Heat shock 70 kDa protein 4L n=1 Tax=Orchesella cincta TaxID=48709 RepID=A0A1D2NM09_ORCCI|nr:Heat shock 70 kDa protein 4L [Orchesella cincta]
MLKCQAKMSVVGIDFGNESCFVAVARAGGIETIDNDYSLRATPSFVAFGERQRVLGVAAKNQAVTNLKNTIFGFKRFLGRRYDDPRVQEDVNKVPFKIMKQDNGGVGIKATYLGQEQMYTPEQVTAMLFTKLKETAENGIQSKVHDCVISVPSYYTDAERRALLDACSDCRLINETAAAALCYGIYKQDLPEQKISLGMLLLWIVVILPFKSVLASTADPNLGGRDFDAALAGHFCVEFRSRYGIYPEHNPRAYMRLLTEVEKLKKQMSANATKLPLGIECFMEEKDVTSSMCRADYEEICASLFQRVEVVLQKCLDDSKLGLNDIHSVEIVGGSTRIPAIKQMIEKVFRKAPSTTLNQDEAVSRGCALQCAILSPAFKVRDFQITDVQPYPIKLIWDDSLGEDGATEVFPQYNPVPFSRMLTFYRKGAMTLRAIYTGQVPYPTTEIGKFIVNFNKNDNSDPRKLKIKARVNMHGIFSICSATIYEEIENGENPEEPMETEPQEVVPPAGDTASSEPMDNSENTDANAASADVNMEEADKKKSKKVLYVGKELPVESVTFGLPRPELDEKIMSETHMISRDRNEKDRIDSRNTLEEYVYDLREKLDMELNGFVEDGERQKLSETLTSLENWLYEDGSDEKKEIYVQKLEELKCRGEPIKERRIESEDRPRAFKEVEVTLQLVRKQVDMYNSKDAKYDHIEQKEMTGGKAIQEVKLGWSKPDKNSTKITNLTCPFQSSRTILERKINPILNTPKPKAEPPKENGRASNDEDAKTKTAAAEGSETENSEEGNSDGPQIMEVEID